MAARSARNSASGLESEDCGICYELMNDRAMIIPCKHETCYSCIKRWRIEAPDGLCPFCRGAFKFIRRSNGTIEDVSPGRDYRSLPHYDAPELVEDFVFAEDDIRRLEQDVYHTLSLFSFDDISPKQQIAQTKLFHTRRQLLQEKVKSLQQCLRPQQVENNVIVSFMGRLLLISDAMLDSVDRLREKLKEELEE